MRVIRIIRKKGAQIFEANFLLQLLFSELNTGMLKEIQKNFQESNFISNIKGSLAYLGVGNLRIHGNTRNPK